MSEINLNELMPMKVTKYDSATIIPKGRFVGELAFGVRLGVAIDRRG